MWLGGNWWFQFLDWDHKEPPEMGRSWLAAWLLGSWQPILDTPATWNFLGDLVGHSILNNLGSKKEPKKLIWWDASHGKNANSLWMKSKVWDVVNRKNLGSSIPVLLCSCIFPSLQTCGFYSPAQCVPFILDEHLGPLLAKLVQIQPDPQLFLGLSLNQAPQAPLAPTGTTQAPPGTNWHHKHHSGTNWHHSISSPSISHCMHQPLLAAGRRGPDGLAYITAPSIAIHCIFCILPGAQSNTCTMESCILPMAPRAASPPSPMLPNCPYKGLNRDHSGRCMNPAGPWVSCIEWNMRRIHQSLLFLLLKRMLFCQLMQAAFEWAPRCRAAFLRQYGRETGPLVFTDLSAPECKITHSCVMQLTASSVCGNDILTGSWQHFQQNRTLFHNFMCVKIISI